MALNLNNIGNSDNSGYNGDVNPPKEMTKQYKWNNSL